MTPGFDGAPFAALAAAIQDPVVIWSSVRDGAEIVDFRYEFVNHAAADLIGKTPGDLVGRRLLDVLPAHADLGLLERYVEVVRTATPAVIEIPWFEDGNVAAAFEVSLAPFGDGLLSVARDVTAHVAVQRRLAEQEHWARSILEHANDAVVHSHHGVVQWASPAVERVLDRTPASLVGQRTEDLCHPDDMALIREMRGRAVDEAFGHLRVRMRAGDGSWRWVDASVRPWRDEHGAARESFVSILRDAQHDVEAARALEDAERRLETILEATHDGIVIIGADGSNRYANGAVRRLSGHVPDEIRGTPALSRIHPDDAPLLRETVLGLGPGEQATLRARVFDRDGTTLHAEIAITNLLHDPAIDGYLATLHDMTGEVAARAALAESEARHRSLMAVVPDAVVVIEEYVITFANEAAAALCGVASPEALVGVSMASFMSADVAAAAMEYGSRFVETGHVEGPFVSWMHRMDGSPVLVEATPASVPGNDRAVLLLMRDIGERERLVAELAASEAQASFLADNSTDVLLRVDQDERVVFASHAASAMLELAPEDVIGIDLRTLFVPDDRDAVDAVLREAVEIGTAEPREVRATTAAHGGSAWVEIHVRSVLVPTDDRSLAVEYHVTLADVQERREARLALAASELRMRTLVESAPVGIFECDVRGRVTYVNNRYCEIAGIEPPDTSGGVWLNPTIHPEDQPWVVEEWTNAFREERPYRAEFRYLVDRGGRERATVWVDVEAVPVVDDAGVVRSFLGTVDDITQRRELEQASFEAAELFSAAFDNAPTGMVLTSVDEPRIIRANAAYLELVGTTPADASVFDIYSIVHPDDAMLSRLGRDELLAGRVSTHHMEQRQRRAGTEEYRWYSLTRSVVRDNDGTARFIVAQLADIHDRRVAEDLAHRLALTDPLTGLSNRRHFLDRLSHAHARLDRAKLPLAVIFVDLDHFKAVNDGLGHDAGDALLADVADRITGSVRPHDTVARLGGDEFAIIVEDVSGSEVRGIAERLCRRVDVVRQRPGGTAHRVTASVGVALAAPPGSGDPTAVLRRADEAMYCAKQLGRARWIVLDDDVG